VLKRPIAYGSDATAAFEQNLRQFMPAWMAYDMWRLPSASSAMAWCRAQVTSSG